MYVLVKDFVSVETIVIIYNNDLLSIHYLALLIWQQVGQLVFKNCNNFWGFLHGGPA